MKPQYAEGQAVAFEDGALKGRGRIRGLASCLVGSSTCGLSKSTRRRVSTRTTSWSSIALPHGCLRALPDEQAGAVERAEDKP